MYALYSTSLLSVALCYKIRNKIYYVSLPKYDISKATCNYEKRISRMQTYLYYLLVENEVVK